MDAVLLGKQCHIVLWFLKILITDLRCFFAIPANIASLHLSYDIVLSCHLCSSPIPPFSTHPELWKPQK